MGILDSGIEESLDLKNNPELLPKAFRDAMKALGKKTWAGQENLGSSLQFGVSLVQATRGIQSSKAEPGSENSRHAHETRI